MSPFLQYEDEDSDKVVLASDSDLQAAIYHAKLAGWKVFYWFQFFAHDTLYLL